MEIVVFDIKKKFSYFIIYMNYFYSLLIVMLKDDFEIISYIFINNIIFEILPINKYENNRPYFNYHHLLCVSVIILAFCKISTYVLN